MKTKTNLLAAGILLTTTLAAFSQPTISSLRLSGQSQTPNDASHFYLSNSVSPGANLVFRVTAGGASPRYYQWQFNLSDLPGQTNISLVLTNVQLTNAGDYTVVVTNAAGATNRTATLTVDPTFTKITTGSVVTDVGYSDGGTWGDSNNDGFLDLFVFNGTDGNPYNPFLYRNNGDGSFAKVTSGPPVNLAAQSYFACWGDYDNDGNLDLYMGGNPNNLLYRNNGNDTFTRITTSPAGQSGIGGWVDYNNDGFLDAFATGFDGSGSTNAHNSLYRNNGDSTFSAITNGSLVTDLGTFLGGAWADYDNDGNPDVFLCASSTSGSLQLPNRLYHNNGDGTFTKVTTGSIVTDSRANPYPSCAWGDYDNDGFLDLFVVNQNGQDNFLYHNNGDSTFTRITNGIVVNDPANSAPGCFCGSYSCAWGDYDNDGWLDLFVTNEGDPSIVPTVVNFLYHNNGDGTFTKLTTGSLVNEYSDSLGCSWADYDNDGFLDLFASRGGGRGNYLYRNNGNLNSWLTVKLVGTASNRAAIGAKVRVQATIGGVIRWQLREITGGGALQGHNELQANFGLGDATNVNLVRIEWPSGIVQTITDVAAKQFLTVTEPPRFQTAGLQPDGSFQLQLTGASGLRYDLETSTNLAAWTFWQTVTNTSRTISITDSNAADFTQRFYRALGQ